MSAVDYPRSMRNFFNAVHKNCTLGRQFIDHVSVMHDLFAHINWSAKALKGHSDNINRANDPGAEPAWFEQEHGFRFNGCSHHLSFSIAGKAKSLIPKYKTQPDGSTKRSATAGFGIDWRLQWGEWMPFRG